VLLEAVTVSVTVEVGDWPAEFTQYSVYVNVPVVVGVTEFSPVGKSTPVQPEAIALALPPAVQELAVGSLQPMLVVVKAGMDVAAKVSVGAGGTTVCAVAFKVTLTGADGPPWLEQVSVYVCEPTAAGVTDSLPLAAKLVFQAPDPVQAVAFAEDQARVAEPPTATEAEPRVNVGVAGGVPV
jgi:hypothetical protein